MLGEDSNSFKEVSTQDDDHPASCQHQPGRASLLTGGRGGGTIVAVVVVSVVVVVL